jgi:intein/homing endonuclease
MPLFNIIGSLGAGKTLSMVFLAWNAWFHKRLNIWSNMHLFKIPYAYIDGIDKLDMIRDGYLCLTPNQKIICNPMIKNISDVVVGDKVLTHTGRFMPVTKTYNRWFDGEIIKIKTKKFNFETELTPNHPVYVATPKEKMKYLMKGMKFDYSWKKAEEIDQNDFCVYPIIKRTENSSKIKKNVCIFCKSKNIANHGLSPKGVHRNKCMKCKKTFIDRYFNINTMDNYFNKDLCYLMGLFLSDGHANIQGGKVRFFVSETLSGKVIKKIKKVFNENPKTYQLQGCKEICIHSTKLTKIFDKFGKEENKRPPMEILHLPLKYQNAFLEGYMDGDGTINKKTKISTITTISPHNAFVLAQILLRKGIIPCIVLKKGGKRYSHLNGGRMATFKDTYFIEFAKTYYQRSIIDGNNLLLPIKEIKKEEYHGLVHNLEVEEDRSYTTMNGSMHNCFDEMWNFIDCRMSRSKKNQMMAGILLKSRKRNLTYVSTSQMLEQLDKRIRKVLDFTATPIMSPTESSVKLAIFRSGFPSPMTYMKTIYYKTPIIFECFDTSEEISGMLDVSVEPFKVIFQPFYKKEHGYCCPCSECGTKFFDSFVEADEWGERWWANYLKQFGGKVPI